MNIQAESSKTITETMFFYVNRKFGMIFNNIIGALAAVLMYFGRTADSYEMIIAGRLVVGIYCGNFLTHSIIDNVWQLALFNNSH